MLIPVLLFIVGLVLLISGGDWFVDGATGIAHHFHIPELLIGATVVSIGTTLPEVMVSATSALGGHGEIAYGNAIGSIICNTSLIAYSTGYFSRTSGIVLLLLFLIYIVYTILEMKNAPHSVSAEATEPEAESSIGKNILFLILGAGIIAVGADLLVDNGTLIAQALGVPESVIALTFVALGTSLPELVTAITSLVKGYGALSLGNVIGANLFNLVLVSGISVTLSPFQVPTGSMIAGKNASLVLDIPLMIFVMLFLTVPALLRKRLSRVQGIVLLAIYAAYCIFQFAM